MSAADIQLLMSFWFARKSQMPRVTYQPYYTKIVVAVGDNSNRFVSRLFNVKNLKKRSSQREIKWLTWPHRRRISRLLMENVTIVLSSCDSLTDKSKCNEKINLNKSFYVKCGPWNLRNSQEEKSIPFPVDLRRGTRQKERWKERERQTEQR